MLKAISLHDPWGSLVAIGAKMNETRPVRTRHRGDIAIHVTKYQGGASDEVTAAALKVIAAKGFVDYPWIPMPFGCVVAVVDLYDVQPSEAFHDKKDLTDQEHLFGNYSPGRFVYRLRHVRRLKAPVPVAGCQAIGWTLPIDVENQVREQIKGCQMDDDRDGNCRIHPDGCPRI
jgi:hypothetical protein